MKNRQNVRRNREKKANKQMREINAILNLMDEGWHKI